MPNQTGGYQEFKLRQLDELSTYRIYGRPVEFAPGSTARRPWRLIFPCLCVQDSPENPCICPPFLWWLRGDMILAEGRAGRRDHHGEELHYFDVSVESRIIVETMHSVSAGALKSLGSDVSLRRILDIAEA